MTQKYIEDIWGITESRISWKEVGDNQLARGLKNRKMATNMLAIGKFGGAIKPSIGFPFLRIQSDTKAIVNSLKSNNYSFGVLEIERNMLYTVADNLMTRFWQRGKSESSTQMYEMCARLKADTIVSFMDENMTTEEWLNLVTSFPIFPWGFKMLI